MTSARSRGSPSALKYLFLESAARLGTVDLVYSLYLWGELLNPVNLWRNARFWMAGAPDGFPIPPMYLITLVAGRSDIGWFLESGRMGAESIDQILTKNSFHLANVRKLLDFGCGCGRVVRHLSMLTGGAIHGTDSNRSLIEWCSRNLSKVAQFSVNGMSPPLQYEEASFDLVYAISVFTHLSEGLQIAWIDELARILRPGGLLVLSTHGERYLDRLNSDDRQRFKRGQLVVKRVEYVGTNLCTSFHPYNYVKHQLARRFTVVDFLPEGTRGSPHQDLYLLKRV